MKLLIASIGKIGKGEEHALCQNYLLHANNLSRASGLWTSVESNEAVESRAQTVLLRQAEEARKLQEMTKDATLIALDPRGQDLSSEEFMVFIQKHRAHNAKNLAFIIGGPDGLLPEFRQNCAAKIRFGSQTWPHKLVRVMLAEQLFRVATLAAGVPYSR